MDGTLSSLGCALLGLLSLEPQSGYGLRRIFSDTPMGAFSDSPGSIYPALRRLEGAGLIRGKAAASGRRRKVFTITPRGLAALRAWLTQPVTPDVACREPDVQMLRLAFMGHHGLREDAVRLAQAMAEGFSQQEKEIASYSRGPGRGLDVYGRLALRHGLDVCGARRRWARSAVAQLRKA